MLCNWEFSMIIDYIVLFYIDKRETRRRRRRRVGGGGLLANGHGSIGTSNSNAVSSTTGNSFVEKRIPRTRKRPSFS